MVVGFSEDDQLTLRAARPTGSANGDYFRGQFGFRMTVEREYDFVAGMETADQLGQRECVVLKARRVVMAEAPKKDRPPRVSASIPAG